MENEYSDLKIQHIKLGSGDEVLALVISIDKGMMHVEYPVLIDILGETYIMSDYLPTAKKNVATFYTSHVVAMCDVLDSVKEAYIKYCVGVTEDQSEEDDSLYNTDMPADKSKYH